MSSGGGSLGISRSFGKISNFLKPITNIVEIAQLPIRGTPLSDGGVAILVGKVVITAHGRNQDCTGSPDGARGQCVVDGPLNAQIELNGRVDIRIPSPGSNSIVVRSATARIGEIAMCTVDPFANEALDCVTIDRVGI